MKGSVTARTTRHLPTGDFMASNIHHFGTLADGRAVQAVTLRGGDLSATVLTWGGILQDVRLTGTYHGLTLGSDNLADYLGQMRHHGALVGPVVNRLSNAAANIGGKPHSFEANQAGRHCLHAGSAGTQFKLWELGAVTDSTLTLALTLPDGEGGFPGNRRITAQFSVEAPATLRMEVSATTDALTLINFANHSYWNLDGTAVWTGHQVRVAASHFLPTTDDFTPTGDVQDVAGLPVDFREMRAIFPGQPDLDNNFCLSDSRQPLRDVLWLTGKSGLTMTVATTDTGIQLYDGRNAFRPGKGAYEGIAIEAQSWPDAPNHAGFPGIEVGTGETYDQVTEWRFEKP
jgi:aldose 1-epimerase